MSNRMHRIAMAALGVASSAALATALPAQNRPSGDLVVVANKNDATASIVAAADGRTLATLPTGQGPHEVAVSHDGRWAVVTDYGQQTPGNTLTVIDLDALAVTRTIDLGEYRRPHGVAFLPGDSLVAVTVEANRAVILVSVGAGAVRAAIPTNEPGTHMLALTADGRRAYTANVGSGTMSALDLVERRLIGTVPVAPRSEGIGVSPDGRQVWVGSNQNQTVTVLDGETMRPLATFDSPGLPYRVGFAPDGRTAVVTAPMDSQVRVFDVAGRTQRALVSVPATMASSAGPVGVHVDADGRFAYVTLQDRNQVAVIDLGSGELVRFLDVGGGPDGLAVARRARR